MLATVTSAPAKNRHPPGRWAPNDFNITMKFLIETTVISILEGLSVSPAAPTGAIAHAVPWQVCGGHYSTEIAECERSRLLVISGLIGIVFGLYTAMTADEEEKRGPPLFFFFFLFPSFVRCDLRGETAYEFFVRRANK